MLAYVCKYVPIEIFKALGEDIEIIDPDVVNISYKQYLSEGLTITEGQQIIWTIVVTAFLPVVVSVLGVVVWVRRKNR